MTEFGSEGFGWIPDLTAADSTMILPVLVGTAFLLNIELSVNKYDRKVAPPKMAQYFTNALRVFSVAMIPLASMVPSGLALYWATSASAGLAVNLILLSPKFRRLVKIPHTEMESARPYNRLAVKFTDKVLRRSKQEQEKK